MNVVITGIVAAALMNAGCTNQKVSSACYKGRLEVKAACSNYTIRLLEGRMDTAKIVAAWKDETTGKAYSNVFRLGNPCSFPASINAGDEFYFVPAGGKDERCAVCLIYYPTPPKKLNIKVLDKPCP